MIIFSENYCKTYATAEPVTSNQLGRNFSTEECIPSNHSKRNNKSEESVKFIDSQRPGLHISTILRQIMFDVLYGVEFVILLTFGFSSDVKVVSNRTEYQVVVYIHIALLSKNCFVSHFLFSSKDLIDQKRRPIIVSVIIFFVVVALCLKIFYYTVMHVWRNVILTGKKLIRQEIRTWNEEVNTNISSRDYSDVGSQGWCY